MCKILIKKHFLFLFLLIIFKNNCFSQQIKFNIKESNDISNYNKKVYLIAYQKEGYYKKITKIDSSDIIHKSLLFNIKNLNEKPYPFYLKFNDKIISNEFYINLKDNHFNIDSLYFRFTPTSLNKNSINYEQNELENFSKDLKNNFLKEFDSVRKLAKNNTNTPQQIDYIIKLRENFASDYLTRFAKYVGYRPNSYFCFWELVNLHYGQGYRSEFEEIFNVLDVKIRKSDVGKLFYSDLMQSKELALGQFFKNISLKNIHLESFVFDVSKNNNKYILIDYWFSHCNPCISQFDDLNLIYSKYKEAGFEIIGISTDKKNDINNWKQIISRKKLKWKQYLDLNGSDSKLKAINKFPTNFLLNHSGEIIRKDISIIDLEKFLQQNLKE